MCTLLSVNGALWDTWLVHCGICATGLMGPCRVQMFAVRMARYVMRYIALRMKRVARDPYRY